MVGQNSRSRVHRASEISNLTNRVDMEREVKDKKRLTTQSKMQRKKLTTCTGALAGRWERSGNLMARKSGFVSGRAASGIPGEAAWEVFLGDAGTALVEALRIVPGG